MTCSPAQQLLQPRGSPWQEGLTPPLGLFQRGEPHPSGRPRGQGVPPLKGPCPIPMGLRHPPPTVGRGSLVALVLGGHGLSDPNMSEWVQVSSLRLPEPLCLLRLGSWLEAPSGPSEQLEHSCSDSTWNLPPGSLCFLRLSGPGRGADTFWDDRLDF